MHFSEKIVSENHLDFLQHAVDHQTLPHAMLFWGPEGTGKLVAALALAEYLLCMDKQPTGNCGKCRSCVKTEKNIHPDVHFSFPIVATKEHPTSDHFIDKWREMLGVNQYSNLFEWKDFLSAEKKQLNISAKECRRILSNMSLRAFEGGSKILIVWMVEHLGKEGNILLKMIEEPWDNTTVILIAEDRSMVLPTILSRCQQFFFRPLSSERIARGLESELRLSPEDASTVAKRSQGNWNLANKIAEKSNFHPVEWMQGWIKIAWSKNIAGMKTWASGMAKNTRDENKRYVQYTLDIWQKLFWIKWGIDFEADPKEEEMLKWLNKKIEFNELEVLVKLCEKNYSATVRNGNASILWMDATLQLRTALTQTHGQLRAQI